MIPSFLRSINSSISFWEIFEYAGTVIVIIGAVGEFLAEFKQVPRDDARRRRFARLAALILIGGLGIELIGVVRTSQIYEENIAQLNFDARRAQSEAESAKATAKGFKSKIADAEARTKNAEALVASANAASRDAVVRVAEAEARAAEAKFELEKLRTPRTIDPAEQDQMISALKAFAGTPFDLDVATDPESVDLMHTIQSILLAAGWKQVSAKGTVGLSNSSPLIGINIDTGIAVQISDSKVPEWYAPANALVRLLRSKFETRGFAATTGLDPNAVHISIGKKP
ncbi:MAG: hypothetical protein WBD87_07800 [Candidatus Acidiferrales bacterium]